MCDIAGKSSASCSDVCIIISHYILIVAQFRNLCQFNLQKICFVEYSKSSINDAYFVPMFHVELVVFLTVFRGLVSYGEI